MLHNVKAGTADTDAVNKKQMDDADTKTLSDAKSFTSTEIDKLTGQGGAITNVQNSVTNLTNQYGTLSANAVQYAVDDKGAVNYGSIALKGENGTKISNLAAGTADTDAVNKKQMADADTQTLTDAKSFTTSELDKLNAEGGSISNINKNISTIEGNVTTITNNLSALDGRSVQYGVTDKGVVDYNTITLKGDAKTGTKLTNIAEGTDAMDAVNYKQFKEVKDLVMSDTPIDGDLFESLDPVAASTLAAAPRAGGATLTDVVTGLNNLNRIAAKYDGTVGAVDKTNMTFQGKGGTMLHNVKAGTADTDAVNKGQLDAIETAYKAADKALQDQIKEGVAGDITDIQTNVTNIQNSLTNLDSRAVQYGIDAKGNVDYTSLSFKGQDGTTLHNVKAGTAKTDAVNKGQLDDVESAYKAADTELSTKIDGLTGTNGSITTLQTNVQNLTNQYNSLDLLAVKFGKNSDGSVNKGVITLGYTDANGKTQGTVIQNLANGTNATDAATKGQVDAVEEGYKAADSTINKRLDDLSKGNAATEEIKKDLGNTDTLADDLKNKDDKGNVTDTSVVDGLNNLNTKVDKVDQKVDAVNQKVDGLTGRVDSLEQTAGKHSSVAAGNGITVTEGTNAAGGKEYTVGLNNEKTTFGDDKNHVTIEGNNGSITATGSISAGQTSISNDGVKVGDKTYISDKGLNANDQKITNVAAGTEAKDAVNFGQLQDVQSQVTENSNNIQSLAQNLSRVDSTAKKGIAGAAALAALHPLDYDPDNKFDVAIGVGSFKGQSATALGAFYRPNENTMFNIGGTFGNGDNAWNAGVSFKVGAGSGDTNTSKTAMVRTIKAQGQALEQQQQQIQAMAAQIDKLLALQKEKDQKGDTSETPLQIQLAK